MLFNNKFLIFLVSLFFFTSLTAQNEFEDGYAILLNKDTVFGEVKKELSDYTFDVLVRPKNEEESRKYNASEIQRVYFSGGGLFESKKVKKDSSLIDVFFECLVLGEVSLYSYVDEQLSERFFIRNQENEIRELRYVEEEVKDEKGRRYLKKKALYRGELTYCFRACTSSKLKKEIKKANLTRTGISYLFDEYYNCTQKANESFVISSARTKKKVDFGIYVGGNYFALPEGRVSGKEKLWGYNYGGFMNIFIPKSNGRYSIEFAVMRYSYNNEFTEGGESDLMQFRFLAQRHSFINEKVEAIFKMGIDRMKNKDIQGIGFVVGGGFGYKVGKFTIINNLEVRLQSPRVISLNVALKI